MDGLYEVLSPWADVDPRPLKGISARVKDLMGKNIGLFANHKRAAAPILSAVQKKLAGKFPTAHFTNFEFRLNGDIATTAEIKKLEEWLKGVDAVIAAVGD